MNRILVIGDLHEPFCKDGYLEFCVELWNKWECNRCVFIGDVIDNHYSSYHETDADGLGGDDELSLARNRIARWYETFPKSDVIIGNHDRIVMRKAQTSAIPTAWIREYKEVLNTPGWNFADEIEIDGVQYLHGEGGTARTRITKDMQSTVQGHLHTQAYIEWKVGRRARVFGMQVGCGIAREAYAMAYAKNFPKPAISAAVVLGPDLPILEMMPL